MIDALMPLMPLMAASSSASADRITELCFYLPFGLLLAVAIVEVFSGGRKSLDLDKAIVVLLVVAGVLLFGNAFVAFSQAGTLGQHAATRAAGLSVVLGIVCAVAALMKQQCYLKKLIALAKAKGRRTRQSGASIWPAFYILFLLASLAGAVGLAVVRPGLDQAPPAGLTQADVAEVAEPSLGDTFEEENSNSFAGAITNATHDPPPSLVAMNDSAADPITEEDLAPADEPEEMADPMEEAPAVADNKPAATEFKPDPMEAVPATTAGPSRKINPAAVRAFKSRVMPIFESKCYKCHGSEEQKGGLRLDSPSWIRKGGDSGAVVVAFEPDKSYLYTSTILPADDPDVMPAKGKSLSRQQTTLIRNWINAGAPMGDGKDQQAAALANASSSKALPVALGDGMPAAVAQQLEGSHIQFKDAGDGLFKIDCSLTRNYDDVKLDLAVFDPIATRVHTLDLSKTKVSNEDLANVAKMSNLRRLLLSRTSVGDEAMAHVASLSKLEILNLYGTNVSDTGLAQLADLANLKKLYLWNSKATAKGGDALKTKNPELVVNVGQ